MGLLEVLTVVLVVLKIYGVIELSWFMVFLPVILSVSGYIVFYMFFYKFFGE